TAKAETSLDITSLVAYQPRGFLSKGAKPFMKPNVIIALLVGGVVGFAVGRMASGTPGGSPGGNQPTAAAPSNPSQPQPAARPSAGDDQSIVKVSLDAAPVRG